MKKLECSRCHKHCKSLTEDGMCAICYFHKYKRWSKDYSEERDKRKK